MQSGPHNFPLGKAKANELAAALTEARRTEATTFLGVWDQSTGHCLGVAVRDGTPAQWFSQGPMTKQDAQRWFDSFLSPATQSHSFH